MRVGFRDHDGKGVRLAAALTAEGYELDDTGDVLLIDSDLPLSPNLELCDAHPRVLLYPHGAWLDGGDGQWPVHRNTVVRFVIGEGQAEVLRRCDYPRPTEIIGWPFCDVLPFRKTHGQRIIFAPQHVMADGWLPDGARERNARIHDFLAYLPGRLIVRYLPIGDHGLDALGITPHPNVIYRPARFDVDDGVAFIDSADVVVGEQGAFPNLAVARGCPTVMYGQVRPDDHECESDEPHVALSWERYADYARFPLDADTAQCPDDLYVLLRRACADDSDIAEWRSRFIGEQFDPARFVKLFEQYA